MLLDHVVAQRLYSLRVLVIKIKVLFTNKNMSLSTLGLSQKIINYDFFAYYCNYIIIMRR